MSTVEVEIPTRAEPTYNFVSFLARSNKWRDRFGGFVAGGWRGVVATGLRGVSRELRGGWCGGVAGAGRGWCLLSGDSCACGCVCALACVRVRGCARAPAGVRVRRCVCAIVDPVGTASSAYWGIFALVGYL